MDLVPKVKKFILANHLLKSTDKVVVGVSGGADSVALIHILSHLRYELGISLVIAHFNHNLRKSAIQDQKFTEKLAQKLHLPCVAGIWQKKRNFSQGSLEETAREERFRFLIHTAREQKGSVIALGHHVDDLAETVLMRLLRGSGLQGLRGILPKREIQGFPVIRPLLSFTRQEIENYLKKNRISYRLDPTNKKTDFFRNKIRHQLLPWLEKNYQKNIREILANVSQTLTADYEFLRAQAQILFKKEAQCSQDKRTILFPLALFFKKPPALQRMLIRIAVEELKKDTNRLTLTHIKEIEDLIKNRPSLSVVHLVDNVMVTKTKDSLTLFKK